jgi:hypothetical protein
MFSKGWRWLAVWLLTMMACGGWRARAQAVWSVPAEIASTHFQVTINGKTSPVMHAALNDYFLNFEAATHLEIAVTADSDDFWAKGVEVQPWRLGIRPTREGRTIRFTLDGPAKISISRPGDFLSQAEMLYLFANEKEKDAPIGPGPGLQYFGPGAHHENIDAVAGGSIYLAPGAVVFGGLNIWDVDKVRVFGRGVIVYDGPQNPANDDGWMHKKNWHCIVMDEAHDVSIEGITCVVRSRTWQIQMKGSTDVRFDNIKVIGANVGNANADGMDWLDGSGNAVINDSFFRAADDIFALQDSWEGYGDKAFAIDGKPVGNIVVKNSVLSTSISNVIRAAWPEKSFRGGHFLLEDSDVIHGGIGGCGIPFAVMEIWADPHSRGKNGDFALKNLRMDDWYSLVNVQQQPVEGVTGVHFTDIFGLETPSLVDSIVKGHVHDVTFDNVVLGDVLAKKDSDIPVDVSEGADEPAFTATGPVVRIVGGGGLVKPGQKVKLEAALDAGDAVRYEWSFGDGMSAAGRSVVHAFPDAQGTLRDGSGRFRVLLHVVDAKGRNGWAYDPVVVATGLKPAVGAAAKAEPGLRYRYLEADKGVLSALTSSTTPTADGVATSFDAAAVRRRPENYMLDFAGFVDVPESGGYTFTLLSNDDGQISIDGAVLANSPKPFAQVCGLAGNAARTATGSVALAKGLHRIEVYESHSSGEDDFRVLWQRAGTAVSTIPAALLSHETTTR